MGHAGSRAWLSDCVGLLLHSGGAWTRVDGDVGGQFDGLAFRLGGACWADGDGVCGDRGDVRVQ